MAKVLIAVPHAGIVLPSELASRVLPHVDRAFLLGQSDMFTDQIYAVPGADNHVFGWSRMTVDPNRFEGQTTEGGVVPLTDFDSEPVYLQGQAPDSADCQQLIERYHRPYHAALAQRIEAGEYSFFIDGHSMMAHAPPRSPDFGRPRPDACVSNSGDAHGESIPGGEPLVCSPALTRFVRARLTHWLLQIPPPDCGAHAAPTGEIGLNSPFVGGHGVCTHARPDGGMPGVQLELNQRLWADEATGQPLPGRIEWLQSVVEHFVSDITEATREGADAQDQSFAATLR
jgi:formiminoglutamase